LKQSQVEDPDMNGVRDILNAIRGLPRPDQLRLVEELTSELEIELLTIRLSSHRRIQFGAPQWLLLASYSVIERRGIDDGSRVHVQVAIASLTRATETTVVPLDKLLAEAAGMLCGRRQTSDVIDASVVLTARREGAAPIVTSDVADLRHLDYGGPGSRPGCVASDVPPILR
jgi:hypothetical protein